MENGQNPALKRRICELCENNPKISVNEVCMWKEENGKKWVTNSTVLAWKYLVY